MMNSQRYPVGIQTFSEIRENGYVYIDKTDLVYEMANGAAKYVFLSRPRRFGKSLLLSTLEAYFQGRKELFEGLAVSRLETEWTQYPVLRFSFASAKHSDVSGLQRYIAYMLAQYEKVYDIQPRNEEDMNTRFYDLVRRACEVTGKKVVVLIDEYDAPLLDVLHEDTELPKLRDVMRNFYSPLKDLDPYLRFVFLTGITKFSQLSIFSELNNIDNISMDEGYAALCGITEQEMLEQLRPGIERLAHKSDVEYEEAIAKLKAMYDGYHFTWPSPDIYNPFSLLNALNKRTLGHYWFGTGTPMSVLEMVRKHGVKPQDFATQKADEDVFDAPTETLLCITPLLYQSGYLTIKSYDKHTGDYDLGIPNQEVENGVKRVLLAGRILPNRVKEALKVTAGIRDAFSSGDVDTAMATIKRFLDTCPYCDNCNSEGHWQSTIYTILALSGLAGISVEERNYKGRMDVVIKTSSDIYILELKVDQSAAAALSQINVKDYAARFALDHRPVTKVGISISSEDRTIAEWATERN